MRAGPGKLLTLTYKLESIGGQLVDTTEGLGRLSLFFEQSQAIPGLQLALHGIEEGQDFSLELPPDQAFGDRDPAMVRHLPRDRFPAETDIFVGAQLVLQVEGPRRFVAVMVTGVQGDTISIDLHHPLAGERLLLTGNLLSVKEATEEDMTPGRYPRLEALPGAKA